ncbi:MAG: hypothetical protein ACKO7N_00015 [Candidatus Nitrosotenuis sp.]
MSVNMTGRAVEFRVKVGARSTIELEIQNDDGTTKNLTNTTNFATGKWKVWKPDGTLLINGDIIFFNRASGIVTYTLSVNDTLLSKAGVWEGEVEIKDTAGNMTEQTQSFNFIIEESY